MEEDYKRVSFSYGILMLRTRRGLSLMDRLGRAKITGPLAWFMLYLLPVGAAISLYIIFREITVFFSPQGAQVISYIQQLTPTANLLLPGINPYIPIVYGWLAIFVAIVVHESAHGIVARSLGLRVKSAGLLLLLVIPIGAFVEVDETQLREVKARSSLRVLAAGSGINLIVSVICLLLLVVAVSSMSPATNGAAILGVAQDAPGLPSPALHAGIHARDFVVAIDGSPVNDLNYALRESGTLSPGQIVNITLWRDGHTIVLSNVTLGHDVVTYIDTRTNQTIKTVDYPYLGVQSISYGGLTSIVSGYLGMYNRNPLGYVVPPAFPAAAQNIPFSDLLSPFYTSSLGGAAYALENTLFWLFFVNFNLAIFNSLPIYPMDGGQAFETFLRGAGRGRIGDDLARRIATAVTVALAITLFAVIAGPYLI